MCLQYICAPTKVLALTKLHYTTFTSTADKMSFILLLVVIAFCVPGLVVWITVGVVVSNPPNGSKWILLHSWYCLL